MLGYQTVRSGMTLGIAVDHVVEVTSTHDVSSVADPDASEFVVAVDAEPDVPIRVDEVRRLPDARAPSPSTSSLPAAGGLSVG